MAFRRKYFFTLGNRPRSHFLVNRLDTFDLCVVEFEIRSEFEKMLRTGEMVQLGWSRKAHTLTLAQSVYLIGGQGWNFVVPSMCVGRHTMVMLSRHWSWSNGEKTDAGQQYGPGHRRRPSEHRHRWDSGGHQPAFISATVVSSIRFEKPHSLSYHAMTLTSRPSMTLVRLES